MAGEKDNVLVLTAGIAASYLANAAHVKTEEIPAIIRSIRTALTQSDQPHSEESNGQGSAPKLHNASVRKSITPDGLISFIDQKPYKTLKRHLSRHGHDIKSYREAYGLPFDYPSVAPSYSAARSRIAKSLRLGAHGRGAKNADEAAPTMEAAAAPAERSRKGAAVASE